MNTLIIVVPYCLKDYKDVPRLLDWIRTLDGQSRGYSLVLAADDSVPTDEKKKIQEIGRSAFSVVDTIIVKSPAPVGENYAVPAAVMFSRAARHIEECYKWPWLWLEPDAVPLKTCWMDALCNAYDSSPKKFMGPIIRTDQPNVPKVHMAGTAIYPNDAGSQLQKFCDGKQHFDMAMADYVVPRAADTPLIFHRWGAPGDPPTFRDIKLPTDGPNVGTLDIIPKEAVLFHRCKDGSLIELLRKNLPAGPKQVVESDQDILERYVAQHESAIGQFVPPPKRRGRPPKQKVEAV